MLLFALDEQGNNPPEFITSNDFYCFSYANKIQLLQLGDRNLNGVVAIKVPKPQEQKFSATRNLEASELRYF